MAEADKEFKWIGTRTIRPDGVDKVTGHATFGADFTLPGMLTGKILRSPHAHARIVSIDTAKAEAVPGVKSVVTSADFPEITRENAIKGESPPNFHDLSKNVMARGKVFYDGHPVAAIAATTTAAADAAIALIEVEYEILPHVIDVDEAMKPDAPVLHDDLFTAGVDPKPTTASNIAKRIEFSKGDIEDGFAKADVIVEKSFTTKPVHQGYIEPHAVVANVA
ncbi:MAG: molybdopterin-dependent oxidoreductase, partial [Alphaproteobacteria bacterium]|nr:molybdopterin-dependent oxidoreductase [Alphaproteobacteria bacterium]